MKHALALLLLLLPSVACAAPPTKFPAPLNGGPPPEYLVRVFSVDDEGGRSAGTGTLIRKDLIITASHVVDGKVGATVEVLFFTDWSVVIGEVINVDANGGTGAGDTGHDLALIKIKPRKEKLCPIGLFAAKGPITIQGFAFGPYRKAHGDFYTLDASARWGIIKGAQARNGDSGGPVTQKGKLVGILWGASENYTWFTPVQKISVLFPDVKAEPLKELDEVKNANPDIIYSLR